MTVPFWPTPSVQATVWLFPPHGSESPVGDVGKTTPLARRCRLWPQGRGYGNEVPRKGRLPGVRRSGFRLQRAHRAVSQDQETR